MKREPRAYSSPLRVEQAAQTRDRIIDALVELLQEGDAATVGMQDVADRAGVSVRTVYRVFPTRDDLFDGLLEAIKGRFTATAGPKPTTAEEYLSSGADAVRAVFEVEPLYRAFLATAVGREAHRRGARQRLDAIEEAFSSDLTGLSARESRLFAALLYLVSSSNSALFLKDYAGLDSVDAGEALAWAITSLVAAIRTPELRSALGQPKEAKG